MNGHPVAAPHNRTVWYLAPLKAEFKRGYWVCSHKGARLLGPFATEREAERALASSGRGAP